MRVDVRETADMRITPAPFESEGDLITLSDPTLDFIVLVRDNRSPTDKPEHFAHPNTAIAITEVWLALDARGRDSVRALLLALGAVESSEVVTDPTEMRAMVFTVGNGRVLVMPDDRQLQAGRQIIGVKFRVKRLKSARKYLHAFDVRVPPSAAHGLWLQFEKAP